MWYLRSPIQCEAQQTEHTSHNLHRRQFGLSAVSLAKVDRDLGNPVSDTTLNVILFRCQRGDEPMLRQIAVLSNRCKDCCIVVP